MMCRSMQAAAWECADAIGDAVEGADMVVVVVSHRLVRCVTCISSLCEGKQRNSSYPLPPQQAFGA
jgi:hypothetical protein